MLTICMPLEVIISALIRRRDLKESDSVKWEYQLTGKISSLISAFLNLKTTSPEFLLTTLKLWYSVGKNNNLKFDDIYIYDVDLNILIKDEDWPLKQADFFEINNHINIDNRQRFIIAGAYFIHQYDKRSRRWSILGKSIFNKYMGIHNLQNPRIRNGLYTL